MSEETAVLDLVDDGDGDGAGKRVAAECGAVHAGGEGACGFFGAEHGSNGNAAGERFGESGDVGLDAEVLIGAPGAGAAHAGLNFVAEEERAGGVAEFASGVEEGLRAKVDAAFALDDFEGNGADFGRERGAESGDVVERDELYIGHDGREGETVFFLVRGCDGAHGSTVEAVFERDDPGSQMLAFRAHKAGVGAG